MNPLQMSGRRLSDNRLSVSLFGEYLYVALSGKLVRRELRIVNHECPVQRYEGTKVLASLDLTTQIEPRFYAILFIPRTPLTLDYFKNYQRNEIIQ
jgi:hypothetical protein